MSALRNSIPVILSCAGLLAACSPRGIDREEGDQASALPTAIIEATDLFAAEDCAALYGVPCKLDEKMHMGQNPPTLEWDHVTKLKYQDVEESGRNVTFSLRQAVSVERARRSFKDRRDLEVNEPIFEAIPDLGDGDAYRSGTGHNIHFIRAPYTVDVEVTMTKGESNYNWGIALDIAMKIARKIDERLKSP